MKILKRLLLTLFVGVVALVAAALFVAANIDPNDYKEKIQAAAEQATGRKLTIAGDVGVTLFPSLSFDLRDVSLGNPPGFEGRFASVERVLAKLDLPPLLQRRVEIGRVTLRKPWVALRTLSDGRSNWEDLAARSEKPPSETDSGTPPLIAGFGFAGVTIEDASVIWRDARAGEELQITELNLKTGALASGKPTDVALSGAVNDKRRGVSADLSLDAEVLVDAENRRVRSENLAVKADWYAADANLAGALSFDAEVLVDETNHHVRSENLVVKADWKAPAVNGDANLAVALNAEVEADLAGERVEIRRLSVETGGARVTGAAGVAGLSDQARITLTLKSDDLAPRKLAAALNAAQDYLPEQAAFELDASFDLAKDSGRFKKLVVSVGGARVESEGTASGLLAETRRINAKLKTNTFDPRAFAEAFGPKLPATADKRTFGKLSVSGELSATVAPEKAGVVIRDSEITLDDSRLRASGEVAWSPTATITLDTNLNVALDRIDAGRYLPPDKAQPAPVPLRVNGLRARIRAANGSLSASEVTARVFGGNFSGAVSFDEGAGGKRPTWRSRGKADGVRIEQVLAAFAVEDGSALKGAGALTYELTASGESQEDLTRSLAGSAELKIEKGAFKNPRLAQNIEQVIAFFEKRPPAAGGKELLFRDAAASLTFKGGAAENRDLEVNMPLLHLRGAGKADLAASRIDYRLRAGLLKQPPGERVYIPINVTGALDDPEYSVDLEEALQKEARKKLRQEAKKAKDRLKEKVGREKDRLGSKAREKLEELLKDKLKLPF